MRVLGIIFSSFGVMLVRAFLGSVAERERAKGEERERKRERDGSVVGEEQSSCTRWPEGGKKPD